MALQDHQVDHLFLLVGGNPLPNYVAAKTLLKEGGTPYFVYTSRTKSYAEALRDQLGADNWSMVELKEGRETDAFHIRRQIVNKIEEILKQATSKNRRIGLNYTGGKKVMAVHAYKAVKAMCSDAVFSYLDPDGIKMVIEQGDNRSLEEKLLTPAVRQSVGMTFDTLWKLHGIELNPKKPFHITPIMPEVAAAIADIYIQGKREEWTKWTQKLNGDSSLETAGDCPFETVRAALCAHHPSIKTVQDIVGTYFRAYEQLPTEAIDWLKGKWLEDYTLQNLQDIALSIGIECGSDNVAPRCSINTLKENEKYFEVDVAFLRGYQLFVISCTIGKDDREHKKKLFEAQLRAQQLGGDEARFALVCYRLDGDKIKREMRGIMKPDIFEVFDVQTLDNLSIHLQNWIQRVDKEAQ